MVKNKLIDMDKYTIGIDYGTDSVRTIIVNTGNGEEVANAVFEYPRWKEGKYCDAAQTQFRHHPVDYKEGLVTSVCDALKQAPEGVAENVVAITADTTGSTPVAVDRQSNPLALKKEFEENPNAMFILWKDHTSVKEAEEINDLAKNWGGEDYTKYEGGVYSSEWFWAKILHVLREDEKIKQSAYSWVELCDWIPALLTGVNDPHQIKRSRCAAGHKAMWHESWGGLPPEEFLAKLDPLLKGLRENLYKETYTSDVKFGNLSEEWAQKLGLSTDVAVGVGAFDAHLGAIGGEIKPYYLTKIIGTSTCDVMVAPKDDVQDHRLRGIAGQVDGSIIPDMIGLEAGQSAFGDVYAWFKKVLMWPVENILMNTKALDEETRRRLSDEISEKIIPELTHEAEKIPVEESTLVAVDWLNGRRTPDANQMLKGAITGLTLGSNAPRIFKALVESTAYGAKAIVERLREEGARIDGIIAMGGVAKKSPFVMQVLSDVLNMPIKVAKSEQATALGSAMAASVVGNIYKSFDEAQQKMGKGFDQEYRPDSHKANLYSSLYAKYLKLGQFIEEELT
jgi:L-ribulokinase